MSTYQAITKHPKTQKFEVATWHDDHFGRHRYGVEYASEPGVYYDPEFDDCEQQREEEVVLPSLQQEPEEDTGEFSPARLERNKEKANALFKAVAEDITAFDTISKRFFTNAKALAKTLEEINDEHSLPRF